MTRSIFSKSSVALLIGLGVAFASANANTTAFNPTPEGLLQYFNSKDSSESKTKHVLSNPRNCFDQDDGVFTCFVDYEETSTQGTRTCVNAPANIYYENGKVEDSKSLSLYKRTSAQTGRRLRLQLRTSLK